MRVLPDTNVVVSALLFGGRPAELLLLLSGPPFEIWTSNELIGELADTLGQRKLARAVRSLGLTVEELLRSYARRVLLIPDIALPLVTFPADPKDGPVIAAALASQSDWLVTGDHHLLEGRLDLPCEVLSVADALSRADGLLRRGGP